MQSAAEPRPSASLEASRLFLALNCLGPEVVPALATQTRWRVLAVFRHSFYIEGALGELVCLGPLSMGAGPLNALYGFPLSINWPNAGLAVGAAAICDGAALEVAERFVFRIGGAQSWRPPPVGNGRRPAALAAGLALAKEMAEGLAPHDSLAFLIPGFMGEAGVKMAAPAAAAAFQRAGRDAAAELKTWLTEKISGRVDRRPPPAIKALLGLGPGLTPAGDDMLGGSMIALHSLGLGAVARELWGRLQPAAGNRTNKISYAHLKWAARGAGADAIHRTMAALLAGHPSGLWDCLRTLSRIGHTSGWDALAGIALAGASWLASQGQPRAVPGTA